MPKATREVEVKDAHFEMQSQKKNLFSDCVNEWKMKMTLNYVEHCKMLLMNFMQTVNYF